MELKEENGSKDPLKHPLSTYNIGRFLPNKGHHSFIKYLLALLLGLNVLRLARAQYMNCSSQLI